MPTAAFQTSKTPKGAKIDNGHRHYFYRDEDGNIRVQIESLPGEHRRAAGTRASMSLGDYLIAQAQAVADVLSLLDSE